MRVNGVALRTISATKRGIQLIGSVLSVSRVKLALLSSLWMIRATPGIAQEAGFVDTRGSAVPSRAEAVPGATLSRKCQDDCALARPLTFHLTKVDLASGSVEWTIRIGNQSNRPIRLPNSMARSGTTIEGSPGHSVVLKMSIVTSLSCTGSAEVQHAPMEVALYGAPDGSIGTTTIDPGQWMTIVGRADSCTDPGKDHDSYSFNISVSSLDSYQLNDKRIEERSPVYADISSGAILWEGPGEMAWAITLAQGLALSEVPLVKGL